MIEILKRLVYVITFPIVVTALAVAAFIPTILFYPVMWIIFGNKVEKQWVGLHNWVHNLAIRYQNFLNV